MRNLQKASALIIITNNLLFFIYFLLQIFINNLFKFNLDFVSGIIVLKELSYNKEKNL